MRFLCILILSASSVAAQPLYTRIRGAFGAEIFGIAGLRFALVTSRWIYILKLRYAPPLIANPLASHVGAGIAVGWR